MYGCASSSVASSVIDHVAQYPAGWILVFSWCIVFIVLIYDEAYYNFVDLKLDLFGWGCTLLAFINFTTLLWRIHLMKGWWIYILAIWRVHLNWLVATS